MKDSTQQFIDIAGIQDGVVVLNNGSYRMVFSVSAVNFSLKSEQEQNSLIFQYQSFLNSLHFPVQIVMRSRRLDLSTYVKKIVDIRDKQTNDLIKMQTDDYIDFISELVTMANIMKKNFYLVVPYDPLTIKKPSFTDMFFHHDQPQALRISDTDFKRYKDELVERANVASGGLGSMGLHCVQLNTEEIIELFYKIYNPEIADLEQFSNANEISSSVVIDKAEKEQLIKQQKIVEEQKTEAEEVIDNSSVVAQAEQQQKKEQQIRIRETEKTVEKAAPKAGATNTTTPAATATPAQPAGEPAPAPKVENVASALNTANVNPAQNTQAPPQGQTPTNQS